MAQFAIWIVTDFPSAEATPKVYPVLASVPGWIRILQRWSWRVGSCLSKVDVDSGILSKIRPQKEWYTQVFVQLQFPVENWELNFE